MTRLLILCHKQNAGYLSYEEGTYTFQYLQDYKGTPISLIMPVRKEPYVFEKFPPFFDGLLPEGIQLEGLLRIHKLDKTDYMGQLAAVGHDLVGAVTALKDNLQ